MLQLVVTSTQMQLFLNYPALQFQNDLGDFMVYLGNDNLIYAVRKRLTGEYGRAKRVALSIISLTSLRNALKL